MLDVASQLFYDRGIRAVGVDTIAEVAQITKKTIYQRFRSKDNLIAAYLERRDQRYRSWLTSWNTEHPAHRIARGQRAWLRGHLAHLATKAGHGRPNEIAGQLLTLHEGATVLYSAGADHQAAATARGAAQMLLLLRPPDNEGDDVR